MEVMYECKCGAKMLADRWHHTVSNVSTVMYFKDEVTAQECKRCPFCNKEVSRKEPE